MNQSDTVFSLQSEHQNSQRLWSWLTAFATAASAALLCYAFINAVGGSPDPLYAVIAVVTVTLEACLLPHKKAFAILNILFAVAITALVAVRYPLFLNGGFLMLNRTFEASQEAQSYVYQMMPITVEESVYPYAEFYFNSVTLFAFSAVLSYYSLKKIPFLPVVVLFITAVSEEYFGVAPTPLLNVALFLALLFLVMASSYKGNTVHKNTLGQAVIAVVLVAAALLCSTFFLYPARYHEHNPYVDEINDKIRDWFDKDEQEQLEDQKDNDNQVNIDEQKESQDQSDEERNPESTPAQDEPEDMTDVDDPENSNTENGADSGPQKPKESDGGQTGLSAEDQKKDRQKQSKTINIWFLIPLLLLLLAAIAWAIVVIAAASKRKKRLNDEDNGAVIRFAFAQSVKWLRAVGLPKTNVPQSVLTPCVEELFDADFATQYLTAVNTWQECLYSNRPMADYRREEILAFYMNAKKQAWHKAKPIKKLRIKLIDLL